jgi:hypothetical protein
VSFILKLVAILLIFSFVVYVLKMIARLSHRLRGAVRDVQSIRDQMSGRPVASAEMVRCAACGAFVSSRDAVTISSRNRARFYCSRDCARAAVAK